MIAAADLQRFWSKTRPGPNGCVIWTGAHVPQGYGHFSIGGRAVIAHRWIFAAVRGPVPSGLHLDHLCRVRACVNVEHLEPVTSKENTMRGAGPSSVNARKTACLNGHPFTGDNTTIKRSPGKTPERVCKACHRDRQRRYSAERKLASEAVRS